MPVLFISHGAPDVLLRQDPVIESWRGEVQTIPRPERILVISAHWETADFTVGGNQQGKTIHDFYGFPDALYEYRYTPPSDVTWAEEVAQRLGLSCDHRRGLDHGAWVPLKALYPDADIPVSQISVARRRGLSDHFALGRKLRSLRREGVLIIASGVVVHNLRALDWCRPLAEPEPWAAAFMEAVDQAVCRCNAEALLNPKNLSGSGQALPSLAHFTPLLVACGAAGEGARVEAFARTWRYRNLSQHSYRFD
jgi:4,5-DOPA dioxygenase extradiol